MPFLTLLLTSPLVFIAYSKKQENEKYYLLKLFSLWLLCLTYITVNNSFRLPIGTICAILIVYKIKFNKTPELIASTIGIISLLLSSIVYLLFRN